ncbi:MAG TPA: hypothetical protein VHT73_08030 [Thermodesulfobacteriota bacterium]|nr:hypothetical protein [Thermodesulfobacteriota bacterium]
MITEIEKKLKAHDKSLLELIPSHKRSGVSNRFCLFVRLGHRDPDFLVDLVIRETERRDRDIARVIRENRKSAVEYARYILAWESLTLAEKNAIKEQRGAKYKENYLKKQPATDRQIAYLKALGCQEEVSNKWEASQLINELTKK